MEKEKLKMIVFDMDGVVIDSEPLHEKARQEMFRQFDIQKNETFPEPVGRSSSGFWRQIIDLCGIEGEPHALEAEQYRRVAKQIKENKVPPSDGLMDVIAWAKEHGVKIGLATSSTRILAEDVLGYLGVRDSFEYVVSGNDVSKKKPSPDIYLKVLELSGIPAECAAAVEDSKVGVEAAKNAGIFCYGYKNATSGRQKIDQADRVIENLREIIE